MTIDKKQFTDANTTINKIEDLLTQAADLLSQVPPSIQQAIHIYHNDPATLHHCLRWGLQAATEVRQDWHTVVADIPCEESEVTV